MNDINKAQCWCNRLYKLMKEKNYTQKSFLKEYKEKYGGGTQANISRWLRVGSKIENGKTIGFPSYETMSNLADFFGVSVGYLIGETDYESFEMEKVCKFLGLEEETVKAIKGITSGENMGIGANSMCGEYKSAFRYILTASSFPVFIKEVREYAENVYRLKHPIKYMDIVSAKMRKDLFDLAVKCMDYQCIRDNEGYGVAIEFDDIRDISEKFANSRLFSRTLAIGGIEKKYLILSCMLDSLRYEFATVCAQFVEPGIDGMDRKNLMSEPLEWWKKWRELMGNTISNKEAYSVIAEMMVLDDLYTQDNTVEWTAVNSGSHDIEGNESCYEVKSTVKRYGATITISGQHQLQSLKRLQLYFCRLEQSRTGISINDMKDRLVADGYDKDKIEQQLYQLGYERGASIREEKYKVLEKRKYEVDDTFPKITKASFKDDHIPESITQITYTIDLDGLEYTVW